MWKSAVEKVLYPKAKKKSKFDLKLKNKMTIVLILVLLGIALRFIVMSFGHNFDFDSYQVVGDISGHLRNVYEETTRYNYGPIFFNIQGLLYQISHISPDWVTTFRVLIVSVLTLFDLGIAIFIARRYSIKKALIFFLNPVSIIITGYHNQFDNIAIFLALLSIPFFNEKKTFGKKDILFILFMSLSLMTKHIFAIYMLFILLKKGLPLKKRLVYAFVPPIIFLLSFLPFALHSQGAMDGIINNVFLYKSFNNSPLLIGVFKFFGLPSNTFMIFFALFMMGTALICRKKTYENSLYIYMIALVAFSSAIANQYLVIPLAAICILDTGILKYIYMLLTGWFLVNSAEGLNFPAILQSHNINGGPLYRVSSGFSTHGVYTVLVWVLFIILIYEVVLKSPKIKKKILNYTRR